MGGIPFDCNGVVNRLMSAVHEHKCLVNLFLLLTLFLVKIGLKSIHMIPTDGVGEYVNI